MVDFEVGTGFCLKGVRGGFKENVLKKYYWKNSKKLNPSYPPVSQSQNCW